MDNQMEGFSENMSTLSLDIKIDPTEYDLTMNALLIGIGAEKYADVFKKQNIGQCTLAELSDEDLKNLGVNDPEIRQKLLDEVKNLPIYEETLEESRNIPAIGPIELVDVLEESSQHLYRIYLSTLANSLALKKTKKVSDCLLYRDKYASDIALDTINQLSIMLDAIEATLHNQLKVPSKSTFSRRNKKIAVGIVGSAAIVTLGFLLIQSIKQLNSCK